MTGKYIEKHVNVYDVMSSDNDSKMKVHLKLLQFDCGYMKNNMYKPFMFLLS